MHSTRAPLLLMGENHQYYILNNKSILSCAWCGRETEALHSVQESILLTGENLDQKEMCDINNATLDKL